MPISQTLYAMIVMNKIKGLLLDAPQLAIENAGLLLMAGIATGIAEMRSFPYMLFIPAMFISLTMLSLQLIGDGLRDATDPKLRQ